MKKLFFTVVVILTFSSASFSSTIYEKEIVANELISENGKSISLKKFNTDPDELCTGMAINYIESIDPDDNMYSDVALHNMFQAFYLWCMKSSKMLFGI